MNQIIAEKSNIEANSQSKLGEVLKCLPIDDLYKPL
jgi:hypothetical protein